MSIISFTKQVFKAQTMRFTIATITLFLAGVTEGASVALLLPLLKMVTNGGKDETAAGRVGRAAAGILSFFGLPFNLLTVLLLIFMVIVIQQLILLLQKKAAISTQVRFEAGLREQVYKAVFNAKWPFFVQTKLGHITDTLSTEVANCGQAVRILNMLLSGLLISIIYLAMALILSWQMTIVIIIGAGLVMLLMWRQTSRGKLYGEAVAQANQNFQDEIIEQVSAAKLIKGYAAQNVVIDRFRNYYEALATSMYKGAFNQAKLRVMLESGMSIILLVAIYTAVTFFSIDIAGLMIILFIFYRLSPRLSNIQTNAHNLNIFIPALQRVQSLEQQALVLKESNGTKKLHRFERGIKLKDVNFSYNPDKPVLRNINLEIPTGKTVAVVGSSGVGKSTIVDLVIGLLEPTKGEVLLDDFPVSAYESHGWKSKIGYVAQDTVLFNDTVAANITWSYPQATQTDIIEAAKLAYAHELDRKSVV